MAEPIGFTRQCSTVGEQSAKGHRLWSKLATPVAKFKSTKLEPSLEIKKKGLNMDTWALLLNWMNLQEGNDISPLHSRIVFNDDVDLECEGRES